MRTDGPFVEAGENDNLIVQRLQADANALGIFGYSFLFENRTADGVAVNGTKPNFETIADGSYDIARPLFFYIKNAHRGVIPGLEEFVAEFVSEDTAGQGGYLSERGLDPAQRGSAPEGPGGRDERQVDERAGLLIARVRPRPAPRAPAGFAFVPFSPLRPGSAR